MSPEFPSHQKSEVLSDVSNFYQGVWANLSFTVSVGLSYGFIGVIIELGKHPKTSGGAKQRSVYV